jgi:hypothetical protein
VADGRTNHVPARSPRRGRRARVFRHDHDLKLHEHQYIDEHKHEYVNEYQFFDINVQLRRVGNASEQ